MREILFLAHRLPWPPDRGDRIRSYHVLKHLAGLARVYVAGFVDSAADARAAEALRPLVASLHVERRPARLPAALAGLLVRRPLSLALFHSDLMRERVIDLLGRRPIEAIYAFSGQMAQFVPSGPGMPHFVMDFVDMDSAKFACYAGQRRGPMRWLYGREARLLAAFEAVTAIRADRSLFVTKAEARLFAERSGVDARKLAVVENGIDLAHYDPDVLTPVGADGPLIVFTGQMDYPPNIEAVARFAREALPLIRSRRPDVRFAIVGRAPSAAVKRLADLPGVIITGEVPDVRPWLAAAAVVVAPLRTARGVQNKILEAMAMARPVVASPAAAEGVDARAGEHLLVADGVAAEAEAVLGLIDDPPRAQAMGRAARARMVERYGWNRALAPLADLLGFNPVRGRGAA